MSSEEVLCNECNSLFSSNEFYNIHKKTNKCLKKNNKNNKYNCPVCDRDFRLLTNLQRHQETNTHIEVYKKIKEKCESENETYDIESYNQDNFGVIEDVKNIFVDMTPRKEISFEEMNEMNQKKINMEEDDFLVNLKKEREMLY